MLAIVDSGNIHQVKDAASYYYAAGFDEGQSWQAITQDARALEAGQDLTHIPLWQGTPPPDWFTKADAQTRAIWDKDPATWAFWRRWWDGVINGKPLPLDLQRDVALLGEAIWQAGPQAVAREIAAIEEKFALTITHNGERVEVNSRNSQAASCGRRCLARRCRAIRAAQDGKGISAV
ncbi:MAG: hypothetical protein U5N55_11900 [Cypionkella sp.]|nr:hypothetical protein [Cypionkella sp.]